MTPLPAFTMPEIRLIALDLDGTLLNSEKQLSQVNRAALERAADMGIHIVPTTGRFYGGMPYVIRALPFIRYVITINGAQCADLCEDKILYSAEIPWQQAVDIMTFLDGFPVLYDCYQRNDAWMTAAQKEHIDAVVSDPHYRKMLHQLRKPVLDLKETLKARQEGAQKIQFFTDKPEVRVFLMEELPRRFPDLCVSSSMPQNVEINQKDANKGQALLALCAHLGLDRSQTLAFGDGLNDLSMLKQAGIGVAMENASDTVKAAADYITLSCDADGVAAGICKFCF